MASASSATEFSAMASAGSATALFRYGFGSLSHRNSHRGKTATDFIHVETRTKLRRRNGGG
jgi:hypothetical protein